MVGGACGFHPCPGVRAFSPDISSEQKTRPECLVLAVCCTCTFRARHAEPSGQCAARLERHIPHKSRFRRIRDLQILQRASQHPSRRRWRSNELIFSKLC